MKLAVVVGGWHWPLDIFRKFSKYSGGVDLFVIAHRSPELPVVKNEKLDILGKATGKLAALDRALYSEFPTIDGLTGMNWHYSEEPNICGDWMFFNQWLENNDYRRYDVILNCHDDTFIRQDDLFDQLDGDWLLLANGRYPEAPAGYVRGSFEFWKRELLDMLGGHVDLGKIRLTRRGKTDTPEKLSALSAWNDTGIPLRTFMQKNDLVKRIRYLSPHYRVSPWCIEGERGFMHYSGGAQWSFEAGLAEFPL